MKSSQVGLKPLEKTGDPFILTRKEAAGCFSFFDYKNKPFNEKAPPPVYLPLSDLNLERDFDKESLLESFEVSKNGELKLVDDDLKSRQSGVFTDILTKLGTNIL